MRDSLHHPGRPRIPGSELSCHLSLPSRRDDSHRRQQHKAAHGSLHISTPGRKYHTAFYLLDQVTVYLGFIFPTAKHLPGFKIFYWCQILPQVYMLYHPKDFVRYEIVIFPILQINKPRLGAGKRNYQLRALTALPEAWSSVSSTQVSDLQVPVIQLQDI